MTKQFVQVSAHKDSNNSMHCSNLSLMSCSAITAGPNAMTAKQALDELQRFAFEYANKGYSIEWITEDFDDMMEEMYGDLFI